MILDDDDDEEEEEEEEKLCFFLNPLLLRFCAWREHTQTRLSSKVPDWKRHHHHHRELRRRLERPDHGFAAGWRRVVGDVLSR